MASRWHHCRLGSGTAFVYQPGRCVLHAIREDGTVPWARSLPELAEGGEVEPFPVDAVADSGGAIVITYPVNGPVVMVRVDASSGADLWRLQLGNTNGVFGTAAVAVHEGSVQVALQPNGTDGTLEVVSVDSRW